MTRRYATILALSLATLGLACVDLSAPKGPAAISLVQLPAKFVVRGDVMRDSAGTPAPPLIFQFNANGQQTGAALAQFFVLDSAPVAHFDPTTGVLVGDRLGTVNFIGQVSGLQTPSTQVFVTVEPQVIDQGTGALDTIKAPLNTDTTLVLPIDGGASKLPVIVSGVGDTGVQGVVVHYTLVRTLASSSPTRQAVYITNADRALERRHHQLLRRYAHQSDQREGEFARRCGSRDGTEGGQRDRPGDGDVQRYAAGRIACDVRVPRRRVARFSPIARSSHPVSRGAAASYTDDSRSSRGR